MPSSRRSPRTPRGPGPPPQAETQRAFVVHLAGHEVLVVACQPPADVELSPAEREVAQLAIDGASNADIAAHRGTSERTVANQLARLYRKLGVGSRVELAARGLPRSGPRKGRPRDR